MSDTDEELDKILDQLHSADNVSLPNLSNNQKNGKKKNDTIDMPPMVLELPIPIPVVKKLTQDIDAENVGDELISQFHNAVSRINEITDEIITNYRADRAQAQQVIKVFFEVIERGGKIPRVFIEKLPDAIRAKSEIDMTPIRLLDSITRFMSASKNNNILINNINQNSGPDISNLEGLLDAAESIED